MTRIFGVGLSRTGTTSLNEALRLLGFEAIHYPSDETTRSEIYSFFATQEAHIRLSCLEHYDAITDIPTCCLYKALDISYPDSKFILTVRDKESWLQSLDRFKDQVMLALIESASEEFINYNDFINTKVYGTPTYDPLNLSAVYDQYHTDVMDYFEERTADFLLLNICGGENWDRLAPFLGRPIPDVPFPLLNHTRK